MLWANFNEIAKISVFSVVPNIRKDIEVCQKYVKIECSIYLKAKLTVSQYIDLPTNINLFKIALIHLNKQHFKVKYVAKMLKIEMLELLLTTKNE